MLTALSTFLKNHEKLILALVGAAVIFFGYNKIIDYLSSHDALVNSKAQVTLQAQIDANKQSADTTAQVVTEYKALVEKLIASNTQIAAAQQQRAQVTQKQQVIDKTLPPDQVVARWEMLTNMPKGLLTATPTGATATTAAAQETVAQLELIPQLRGDLEGQETVVVNDGKQIDALTAVNAAQTTEIAGLGTQIQDQTKACVAQVALVKAKARKSKLHWFEIGFISGFVVRQIVKTEVGV